MSQPGFSASGPLLSSCRGCPGHACRWQLSVLQVGFLPVISLRRMCCAAAAGSELGGFSHTELSRLKKPLWRYGSCRQDILLRRAQRGDLPLRPACPRIGNLFRSKLRNKGTLREKVRACRFTSWQTTPKLTSGSGTARQTVPLRTCCGKLGTAPQLQRRRWAGYDKACPGLYGQETGRRFHQRPAQHAPLYDAFFAGQYPARV